MKLSNLVMPSSEKFTYVRFEIPGSFFKSEISHDICSIQLAF